MELAEIKQFLGLPYEVDSLDKFKEHFNSSYISKDKAHSDDTVYNKAAGDVLRRVGSKVSQNLATSELKQPISRGKTFTRF